MKISLETQVHIYMRRKENNMSQRPFKEEIHETDEYENEDYMEDEEYILYEQLMRDLGIE